MDTFTKSAMKVRKSMNDEVLAEEIKVRAEKLKEFFIKENNKRDQMVRNGLTYTP